MNKATDPTRKKLREEIGRVYQASLIMGILLLLSSCQQLKPAMNPSDLYGTWGGQGLVMELGPQGAALEYDCATGRINEPILPDAQGMFQVSGTHNAPSLPVGMPDPPPADIQPAHFSGKLEGQTMQITVTLDVSGSVLGPYELTFEDPGELFKCL